MKCPGQDSRYWKPDAVIEARCPECGHEVEFFKDETTRKCRACGHRFLNPGLDFGCAAYCRYAEQCIGNLPPELIAQKKDLLKDRVAIEVKRHYKRDFKSIGRATRMARHAEEIGKAEQGDLAVILPAAYLDGIAVREPDGLAVVRQMLENLGADEDLVRSVCELVDPAGAPETAGELNRRILLDAARLVDLEEKLKETGEEAPSLRAEATGKDFLTEAGRGRAVKMLESR